LIKAEIIIKSRTLGKIKMWRLNRENPKVKVLMQTAIKLSLGYLESIKAKATTSVSASAKEENFS